MNKNLQYAEEIYKIQGAIFAVYKEMGNAWHEEVTSNASNESYLCVEFLLRPKKN